MQHLFDADAVNLTDLAGDPNLILEVQDLVRELLEEAGEQRRLGIAEKLAELGAWAVPGLISASYVFAGQLPDETRQQKLADLLTQTINENDAARELVLKKGIIESPFPEAQQISLLVLQQDEKMQKLVLKFEREAFIAARRNRREREYALAVNIYRLLLETAGEAAYSEALDLCVFWFNQTQTELKWASRLFDALLQHVPRKADNSTYQILGALNRKDAEAGKAFQRYVHVSAANFDAVCQGAARFLRQSWSGRHKAVEYIFRGPVAQWLRDDLSSFDAFVESGEMVRHSYRQLIPYWWQAVSENLNYQPVQAYLESQLWSNDDEFAHWAAVQLFFKAARNAWARIVLQDLEMMTEDAWLYTEARKTYETLTQGGTPSKLPPRPTGAKRAHLRKAGH